MSTLHERIVAHLDEVDRLLVTPVRGYQALRAVVELHAPHEGRCRTCVEWCDCLDDVASDDVAEAGQAALRCTHGNVPAPCSTIQAIARELGVNG